MQLPAIRAREQNGKANGTASRLGIAARRWNEPARGAGVRPQKDDDAGGNAEARGAGGAHEAETDAELRATSDHARRRHEADAIRSRPCARRAGASRAGAVPATVHDGEETSQSGDGDGKETRGSKAVGALRGGGAPFQGRCPPPLGRSWRPPARPGTLRPHFLGREEEPPWGQLDLLASPPAPEEF